MANNVQNYKKKKENQKRTGEKREEHSMMQHDRQIETIKSHDVMK